MCYFDRQEMVVGDSVPIHGEDPGIVVAVFDNRQSSDTGPEGQWLHLAGGVMVGANFAGLVHYQPSKDMSLKLLKRGQFDWG